MKKKLFLISFIMCIVLVPLGMRYYAFWSYFYDVKEVVETLGPKKTRILLLWGRGIGEEELVARMKIASNRKGIALSVATVRPSFLQRIWLKNPVEVVVGRVKPNVIFSLQVEVPCVLGAPNYLWVSKGAEDFCKEVENNPHLLTNLHQFSGFLCAFDDIEPVKYFLKKHQISKTVGKWFPGVFSMEYEERERNKLFYCGANWDKKRSTGEYRKMFCLLDKTNYLDVYGLKSKWKHTPNSYGGYVPFDGTSLLDKMKECGIVLVLHSEELFNGGAISSRIFEASAASCVSISDPHPFIKKYFGDNVLYLDHTQKGEDLFKQIDKYVLWIKENPKKAEEMARNCYQIAAEQFSLESQIKLLADLAEKVD